MFYLPKVFLNDLFYNIFDPLVFCPMVWESSRESLKSSDDYLKVVCFARVFLMAWVFSFVSSLESLISLKSSDSEMVFGSTVFYKSCSSCYGRSSLTLSKIFNFSLNSCDYLSFLRWIKGGSNYLFWYFSIMPFKYLLFWSSAISGLVRSSLFKMNFTRS